jgi:hypothetical protein
MSLYIVAIGGTGARCVEAITQLAAANLFGKEKIEVVFIDPDESNGNLTRTRETIQTYQRCRNLMTEGGGEILWMQSQINSLEVWSPFQGSLNKSLGGFFNYERYQFNRPELGHLFDVLYTKAERDAELDVGFRGRPAIGSAIMSQIKLDATSQEPWRSLVQNIEMDLGVGKSPKVFLCGSIFGGTGASGFPTIGKLLDSYLKKSGKRDRVKLGGLLMLPYFQFSIPVNEDPGGIYARPEQFLLNTEAALRYYQMQSIFDTIYLLGDQDPAQVQNFSIGKNTQKNDPHFIELFAGLAARHFTLNEKTEKVVLLSRREDQSITWEDIPDKAEVKRGLANTARFAYVWVANVAPELNLGKTNIKELQKGAPWFSKFFMPKVLFGGGKGLPDLNDELQQDAIQSINEWCISFLRWIGTIHYSADGRNVQLFRASLFLERNGEVRKIVEDLPRIVAGADGLEQSKDATPQSIKEQLVTLPSNQPGAAGLASSLYPLCKP